MTYRGPNTVTELWLRQLWKLFDNSPKRTAMYLKVQINMKSLVLSDKSKKVVAKKFKKACQTRWLSFHAATQAIHDDFLALQHTLRQLKDNDAVACGLLSKIDSSKFIGTIYILKEILPVPRLAKQELSARTDELFPY